MNLEITDPKRIFFSYGPEFSKILKELLTRYMKRDLGRIVGYAGRRPNSDFNRTVIANGKISLYGMIAIYNLCVEEGLTADMFKWVDEAEKCWEFRHRAKFEKDEIKEYLKNHVY